MSYTDLGNPAHDIFVDGDIITEQTGNFIYKPKYEIPEKRSNLYGKDEENKVKRINIFDKIFNDMINFKDIFYDLIDDPDRTFNDNINKITIFFGIFMIICACSIYCASEIFNLTN